MKQTVTRAVRSNGRPLRVLHCPLNTAGNPGALAAAERAVGLDSWSVAWTQSPFSFACDEVLWHPGIQEDEREAKRAELLRRAVRDYDVIHFNWGETIMPIFYPELEEAELSKLPQQERSREISRRRQLEFSDLPLLKALGKVIAVTYQGDDARQGDYIRDNFEVSPYPYVELGYYTLESDARKRRHISYFRRYADLIYTVAIDVMHVLPMRAKFVSYATVDPRDWIPVKRVQNEVPVVLHAPTHRGFKGTEFVLAAFDRLKAEGIAFEPVLVENRTHEEARQLYRRADLLVDQLLAGNYGALAVELMALGKPVVAYMRDADFRFMPKEMRNDLPVISASPDTIYDVLKEMLTTRRQELPVLGRKSREFVEVWYDPLRIASDMKADYERAFAWKRFHPGRLLHEAYLGYSGSR